MWSLSRLALPQWPAVRAGLIAVGVASVFAAGWTVNGWRWEGRYKADMARLYQAGIAAYQRRDAETKEVISEYKEALASRKSSPARRVYLCPPTGTGGPATAPGGAGPAGEAGADSGAGRDIGPVIEEARDELLRFQALIQAVAPPE